MTQNTEFGVGTPHDISYHPGMCLQSRSTHRTSSIIVSSKEIPVDSRISQNVSDWENDTKTDTETNYNNCNNNNNNKNNNNNNTTQKKLKSSNNNYHNHNNTIKNTTKAKTIDEIEHGKLVPHNYTNTNTNNTITNNLTHINTTNLSIEEKQSQFHDVHPHSSVASVASVASDRSMQSIMSTNSNLSEISRLLHPLNKYGNPWLFKASNTSNASVTSVAATVDELDTLPNMEELSNYDKHKELGNGTDAHVYELVDRRDKSHVAMKLTKRKSGRYRTEIHLLHQLRTCPFVVKLLKVLEDESVYVLILEQAPMTLEQLLHERCTDTPMQERVGKEIILDVMKGICAIHFLGFLHKDLKPENVLIFADRKNRKLQAKIADFGFATRAQYVVSGNSNDINNSYNSSSNNSSNNSNSNNNSSSTANCIPNETISEFMERVSDKCGTPGFWAPELVAGCVSLGDAFKMDVFSCGVTLYRMLCNEMPFGLFETWQTKTTTDGTIKLNKMKPNFQVISWIKTQNINEIDPNTKQYKIDYIRKQSKQQLSQSVETLLRGMLRIRPYRRFTVEECLAHEWFKIE